MWFLRALYTPAVPCTLPIVYRLFKTGNSRASGEVVQGREALRWWSP